MPTETKHGLTSWKEIATFLGRDVRTVQRWERESGLPVHRAPGEGRHSVYACPEELDAWLRGQERGSGIGVQGSRAGAVPRVRGQVPGISQPSEADAKLPGSRAPEQRVRVLPVARLGIGLVAAVLIALLLYLRVTGRRASASAKPRRSIAVLGFRNASNRPETAWLSSALSEELTTELAAGGKLRAIPEENVLRMKMNLALSDADSLADDTLARIRENLSTDLVVVGSYLDLGKEGGGKVRLDLRLQDANNGETISLLSQTGTEADLFTLVAEAGSHLREKLGIEDVSPAQANEIRASLPWAPQAAKLYAQGITKLQQYDALGARDLLQQAVELEPGHALSHAALADAWLQLGYDEKAKQEAKKAFDLSSTLSREDRLAVEARYREAMNDWGRVINLYRTLFTFFPDDPEYGLHLAQAETRADQPKEALAALAALRRLPPPAGADPRIDLAEAQAFNFMPDPDHAERERLAAEKAATKAEAQGATRLLSSALIEEAWASLNSGHSELARNLDQRAQSISEAAGDRRSDAQALTQLAIMTEDQGDLAGGRKMYEAALALYREIGNKRGEAATLDDIGEQMASQGAPEAKRTLEQALALYREIEDVAAAAMVEGNMGVLLYDQGQLAQAEHVLNEEARFFRQAGNRDLAQSLTLSLGDVLFAQGDLNGAEKAYAEAAGEGALDALRQSELSIEKGDPARAERLAAQFVGDRRFSIFPVNELGGRTLLALALLEEGKTLEARQQIELAAPLAEKIQDVNSRIKYEIVAGRVRSASGKSADIADATRSLRAALAEATSGGFVGYQFWARLAQAEIEVKSGNAHIGRAHLTALERDATAKGYGLVAHKATIAAN
jgi:eukaryotic-like serine/threonine-protein kinase